MNQINNNDLCDNEEFNIIVLSYNIHTLIIQQTWVVHIFHVFRIHIPNIPKKSIRNIYLNTP